MGQERHDEDFQGERYQMKHIHIVMGSQGEYSDFQEWPVVAYTNEAKARKHVSEAQDRCLEIQKEIGIVEALTAGKYWDNIKKVDQSNVHDESCFANHVTGEVTYCMWTVEVKE